MLYEAWVIMLAVGILLMIVTIVLCFVFHIPELIDELSGNKARRQIKRLKEINAGTGSLDVVATKDVYSAMGSGVLTNNYQYKDSEERVKEVTDEIKAVTSEQFDVVTEEEVPTSYTEDTDGTSIMNDNYNEDEAPTSFVEEESCVTGILEDLEISISGKRTVIVLKEQTSIKEDD